MGIQSTSPPSSTDRDWSAGLRPPDISRPISHARKLGASPLLTKERHPYHHGIRLGILPLRWTSSDFRRERCLVEGRSLTVRRLTTALIEQERPRRSGEAAESFRECGSREARLRRSAG